MEIGGSAALNWLASLILFGCPLVAICLVWWLGRELRSSKQVLTTHVNTMQAEIDQRLGLLLNVIDEVYTLALDEAKATHAQVTAVEQTTHAALAEVNQHVEMNKSKLDDVSQTVETAQSKLADVSQAVTDLQVAQGSGDQASPTAPP